MAFDPQAPSRPTTRLRALALAVAFAATLSLAFFPRNADAQGHGEYAQDGQTQAHEGVAQEGATHGGGAAEPASGEHGEQHWNFTELAASIVNFLLLLAILYYLGRRPMGEYLKSRRFAVEQGLEEAKRMKSEAEAKHRQFSDRLAQLDDEMAAMRKEMAKAGELERDRIVAEAEAKASRIRKDTEFLIEQQLKQLRIDLTREAVEAAIGAASAALMKTTTDADQERVGRDYLAQLGEIAATGSEQRGGRA